ncbi:MAG: T9SS type A sorting domain-containing protein, partial [Cyclobacteriaceae bacterium]
DEGMNFTATDLATQEVSRVRPDATSLTSYQEFKLTLDILETTRFVRLQIQAANQSNIYYFDNFSLSADDVVVWEGSAWSNNGAGPTATDIVVINDVLNVNSDLAVKDIMVKSGTLTLQSGSSLNIAGTATGSATVMRNTTGNSGYSIVGAPVSGANLSALSADYLYTWNGSSWITPTESMISGMGYFAGYDAATPTVTLTGTLVSGDQTAAVTTAGDGFNLVANPYAAAISITNFLSESSNSTIDGSVYFWNDGGTNNGSLRGGDYVTVNAAGNVSNIVLADGQNGQNTSASNTHIGSMQGFFVHATSDGNLTFKPTMQTSTAGTNADANYYRQTSENQAKLKLSLSGDHYSEVLFAFRADGTLGWDRHLDALHKTSNETFAFYSLLGEKRFSIQGLPELLDTEIIKLGYDLETAGEYVLSINKFENISDSYRVVANYQGESFDITGNDAVLNLTAGRGEIELTITNTRVLSAEIQSELSVYNREGLLKIQMNESLDKASIHIIDIQGRSHFYAKDEQLVKGQWSKNVNLHSGQLYVLRITSKNGVLTKKFIY